MSLTIKPAQSCAFDQISLGEVMLRLDPGDTTLASRGDAETPIAGGGARVMH